MNGDLLNLILGPVAASAVFAFTTTPLIILFAKQLGILDDPKHRKHPAPLHQKPIPRGGGVPVFLAILFGSMFFLPIDQKLLAILIGGLLVTIVGLWDDKKDLNPYLRLAMQFLAATIVVTSGIGISFISNPLGMGTINLSNPELTLNLFGQEYHLLILSALFGILWIVGLMNAVNWSSGVDGQLSGFTAIAALVIAVLSLRFSADITQWPVTVLAAVTCGAFLGFLFWHMYPQKIMPGFGGSTLAGFMLAVLSILATAKVGTLFVVLAIPILDAGYSFIRRILSGKSPVWGDRGHLHHKLLDAGWSKKQVALFYWVVTALLGFLALNLNTKGKFYTMIGVTLLLGGILVWLSSFFPSSKQRGHGNG